MMKQKGYALLLFLLVIVGTVSTYVLIDAKNALFSIVNNKSTEQSKRLMLIKSRLLNYAISIPELYSTDTNNNPYPSNRIPAPGYLPCPDTNGDGAMNSPCGQGTGFAAGRLPIKISSRNFTFLNVSPTTDNTIFYVVDSRYVIQNSDFNNPPVQRYAPLNGLTPAQANLTLNSQNDFVALIFDAGQPLNGQTRVNNVIANYLEGENANGDALFVSGLESDVFNDQVVGITRSEWLAAVRKRIEPQASNLCAGSATDPQWFNACHNDDGGGGTLCPDDGDVFTTSNPVGSNWRNDVQIGCP